MKYGYTIIYVSSVEETLGFYKKAFPYVLLLIFTLYNGVFYSLSCTFYGEILP